MAEVEQNTGPRLLRIEQDSVRASIRRAVSDICATAEAVRRSAMALESVAAELGGDAATDDIKQVATSVRSSALSMLLGAATLTAKAEHLEVVADVQELGDAAEA